ncbi:OmpA family protein [Agrobacterium rosae]|uniref:OmpA family protein n=1 Tax=Agrobacterium rosae TaxID=1972867 RepID=UPI0019D3EB8A|nr:OmpA family protein [Agrobacterium rosae]MBN7808550.1 OmpA family protein [Agrobacterium rosae]
MRVAFCLALLLATPATASVYTVTTGIGSVSDQQSIFEEMTFPASSFAEQEEPSTGDFSSQASTFELQDMDEDTRVKTQGRLTELGARQEDGRIIVNLPSDVLFDFDKSEIRADARSALTKLAQVLSAMDKSDVQIIGHTDAKGSDAYNDRLSERRAASVKDWLSEYGVMSKMTTEGKGERFPVAPNQTMSGGDDPQGRQKNRRVEFIIGER